MHQAKTGSIDSLFAEVRHQCEIAFERVADAIKDALLDWGEGDDAEGEIGELPALPPLPREKFIAALRVRLEETLAQVADAISEAPLDQIAFCEERIGQLVAQLCGQALEMGLRMRLEAANPLSTGTPAQGEWARKYRRMQVGYWDPESP